MDTVMEGTIDRARLTKVTYDLWECLNSVRQGGGTQDEHDCLDRYYTELKTMIDEYYSEFPRPDANLYDLWFSREVLDAYRDLRHKLHS